LAENGDKPIGEVEVKQKYSGMMGKTGLVSETTCSIRLRHPYQRYSIPKLKKGGFPGGRGYNRCRSIILFEAGGRITIGGGVRELTVLAKAQSCTD